MQYPPGGDKSAAGNFINIMNEIIKTIEKTKSRIIIAISCLMFIFFGLCSAVDVAGKAHAGGLKVLFDGTGLGFARFLSAIILIIPILIIAGNFVNLNLSGKLKEHFNAICFVAGFVCCLFLAIALPGHITLAWGSWLYILLAVAGGGVSCIEHLKRKL